MTPVATRTAPAPAVIAAKAHRALDAVLSFEADWPPKAYPAIGRACLHVAAVLERYRLIDSGEITWECFYPELSVYADPHDEALMAAAREAEDRARLLGITFAACCGTDLIGELNAMTAREEA